LGLTVFGDHRANADDRQKNTQYLNGEQKLLNDHGFTSASQELTKNDSKSLRNQCVEIFLLVYIARWGVRTSGIRVFSRFGTKNVNLPFSRFISAGKRNFFGEIRFPANFPTFVADFWDLPARFDGIRFSSVPTQSVGQL